MVCAFLFLSPSLAPPPPQLPFLLYVICIGALAYIAVHFILYLVFGIIDYSEWYIQATPYIPLF